MVDLFDHCGTYLSLPSLGFTEKGVLGVIALRYYLDQVAV